MPASVDNTARDQELCGKWMPKAKVPCARKPNHNGFCMSAANMEARRAYRKEHPHRQTPEAKKKTARKSRITAYGLTQKQFDWLLEIQRFACAMCEDPFHQGQLIHVDHDHNCCEGKNKSCGKCVRGLLCHTCNIALGHIERRLKLARAYLNSPPARLLSAA
jgi:recombination endonuclease VII